MPHQTATLRLFAAAALLLASSLASAQYSWIGENGVRQFSDRPPPPSTPPHKILKTPDRTAHASPPAPAPAPAREPQTLAEREAQYIARSKMREEQERTDQAEAQRRRDLAEHCQNARDMRAQVQSGIRIARFDDKGERVFISDEERAAQLARANRILAECP